jgi:hypothetical protein
VANHVDADPATLMLAVSALVVSLLIVLGSYRLAAVGDVGDFFRNLAIGSILTAFAVGFYRKWHR